MAWSDNWEQPGKSGMVGKSGTGRRRIPARMRGLAALLVVAAVGGITLWLAWPSKPPAQKPVAATRRPVRLEDKPRHQKPPPVPVRLEDKPRHQDKPEVKAEAPAVPPGYVAVTNAGKVVMMTEKEAAIFARAQRDSTVRTRTEKALRLLASVPPGMPVPPMPFGSADMDKDIVDTLLNEIEILPDDTEREREQKAFVIAFKDHLREELKKGRKPSEVYRQYVNDMNSVASLTTEALRQARQLIAEGDRETADAFVQAVNRKIEAVGGPPIDLNRTPKPRKAEGTNE